MKRVLVAVCAFLAALTLLSGCGEKQPLPAADYSLTVKTVNTRVDGVGVTLMLPVVSGYADEKAEAYINERLLENAWAMFRRENLVADEECTFEYSAAEVVVTLETEGFFSAYVGGLIADEGSGRMEYFSYTVNCDIKNGMLYSSDELLLVYEALAARFEKGQFQKRFGHPELLENTTYGDMILPYSAEYEIYPDVFFTDTEIGFLIEVVPSLAGYAGFTLPLRSAGGWLNSENPMVAFITGK